MALRPITEDNNDDHRRLLLSLAEELRLPLLQVSQASELYEQQHDINLKAIRTTTEQAMWLIDGFLMASNANQQQLNLQPVSVSSLLDDTAHILDGFAKQYNCQIELNIEGKYMPIITDKVMLQTAIVGIGTTLIAAGASDRKIITLGAHKSGQGVATGVFSEVENLGEKTLRRGRALYGRARQPLQTLTAQPAAGIFIADRLFDILGSELKVAQHNKQKGIAGVLQTSRQLALI